MKVKSFWTKVVGVAGVVFAGVGFLLVAFILIWIFNTAKPFTSSEGVLKDTSTDNLTLRFRYPFGYEIHGLFDNNLNLNYKWCFDDNTVMSFEFINRDNHYRFKQNPEEFIEQLEVDYEGYANTATVSSSTKRFGEIDFYVFEQISRYDEIYDNSPQKNQIRGQKKMYVKFFENTLLIIAPSEKSCGARWTSEKKMNEILNSIKVDGVR